MAVDAHPPSRLQVNSLNEWNAHIPVDTEEALAILTRDLPDSTTVEMILLDDGRGKINMSAPGVFSFSSTSFNLKWHELHIGVIEVQEQGLGIGRHAMGNQIEFFRKCGVNEIHTQASKDAGGYTWARFGFLPNDVEDYDFSVTKYQVAGRFNLLRSALDEDLAERLEETVALENEKDMWRIADTDADVGPALRDIFNSHPAAFEKFFDREGGKTAVAALFNMAQSGQSVPLGRALLAGTQWDGHINTNDTAQMSRITRYTR